MNRNKIMVEKFYALIDAQNWSEQETMVTNDFVAHLGGLTPISFKAWQSKVRGFYNGMSDGHHVLDFYEVEGDRVLTVGRFIGLHRGEFMGRTATGSAIEMGVMHLDRVVGDKIVEHTAAADLLGLLGQIDAGSTSPVG